MLRPASDQPTPAELEVLKVLWDHGPATVRQVMETLNPRRERAYTILFFHPAVWWLSSRLQREREWCCDAFAVRVTGEPVVYVQALEHIAGRQRERCMPSLAAGMKGGRKMLLLSRIERVLGVPSSKADSRPAGLLLASLLLAGGFVWLAGSGHPLLAEVGEGTPGEDERR